MGLLFTTSKKQKELEEKINFLNWSLDEERKIAKNKIEKIKKECAQKVKEAQEKAEIEVEKAKNEAAKIVAETKKYTEETIAGVKKTAQEEIETEKESCQERIRCEHEKCQEEMTKLREYIESRRTILEGLNEKSLLVDIMMALEGYGSRLNRLEDSLSLQAVKDKITEIKGDLHKQVVEMSLEMRKEFDILDGEIKNRYGTQKVIEKLEEVNGTIDDKINQIISEFEENLNEIDVIVALNDIKETVEEISNKVDADCYDSIELTDIKTSIEKIINKIGGHWYSDTLMDEVERAKSAAEDAKSAAEDCKDELYWVKTSVEDAKSAVEAAKATCESNKY